MSVMRQTIIAGFFVAGVNELMRMEGVLVLLLLTTWTTDIDLFTRVLSDIPPQLYGAMVVG